ncbi:MAG: hypothetical protein Q7K03_08915 [Dehalococcoidia bacterium]|nr:hypothetical protein [Dehalococcoidia bacterium]
MDVFDFTNDEVLLIPMHRPAINVQNHVSRDYVPPKGILPFVVKLNPTGRPVAVFDRDDYLVIRGIRKGSPTQSFPNSVPMKQRP